MNAPAAVLFVALAWAATASAAPRQADPTPGPAEVLQQAIGAFFAGADFAAAERGFRRVWEDPRATADQREDAGFYLGAALARQEKHAEAVAIKERWLALFPASEHRSYVRLFLGLSYAALGETAKARAAWQRIVDDEPDSDLAEHARGYLDGGGAVRSAPASAAQTYAPRPMPRAIDAPDGGYLVVTIGLAADGAEHGTFAEVARRAAAHHGGTTLALASADDLEPLRAHLAHAPPRNVLFVVPPELLDVVLHRRILMLATRIDEDVFTDFAFGYLTAADGAALERLWARSIDVSEHGLAAKTWIETYVMTGAAAREDPGSIPDIATAAGFTGGGLAFATVESDPDVQAFVDRALPRLEEAGVVAMTGNGDPQGIWLFADSRNADRARHWDFDPAKVGFDPSGEMPRITAPRFRELHLRSPVVWSGTCHSGATRRVFVEGDIVSTFGRTDRTTVYDLAPEESLCLALIDAGAAALLVPIAANHGMSVMRECEFALAHGATLGATIKSTYDDLLLPFRGGLALDLPVAGEPHVMREPIMAGAGANRILIGDPALAPFAATPHPAETVRASWRDDALVVEVAWQPGFHAWGWDMFGNDLARDWRIAARVPIEGDRDLTGTVVAAEVDVVDETGAALPYVLTHAEPEVDHGRRYLHLRANGERGAVQGRRAVATFTVRFVR
jgi:tetratricopeptide (TPR) repeat protein